MTAIKYTFDNDFDNSGAGGTNLSADKLEEVKAECYRQGVEAGKAEALSSIEQNSEYLLQNITGGIQNLQGQHDEYLSMMHRETANLARIIIRKFAPALLKKNPLDEIDLLVEQCLKNSPLEPRLVVRIDEEILPLLEEKIDKIKLSNSYAGQIVLIGEQMNNISDCRVEWADGGADRDFDTLMATIDTILDSFINAPVKGHLDEKEMAVNISSDARPTAELGLTSLQTDPPESQTNEDQSDPVQGQDALTENDTETASSEASDEIMD